MLDVGFNRTTVRKSDVLLTFRIRAGGWRASLDNGRPHSWNLVAAPQCPAAVASRDPHRAATPPSATTDSITVTTLIVMAGETLYSCTS